MKALASRLNKMVTGLVNQRHLQKTIASLNAKLRHYSIVSFDRKPYMQQNVSPIDRKYVTEKLGNNKYKDTEENLGPGEIK